MLVLTGLLSRLTVENGLLVMPTLPGRRCHRALTNRKC